MPAAEQPNGAPHPAIEGSDYDVIYQYLKRTAAERLDLKPEVLDNLQPEHPIVEGLQLDSLALVTVLAAIEDDLGVVLEPEDRANVVTVDDLVRFILQRTDGSAARALKV